MDSKQDAEVVRWLSYDEIAELRGIDRASAIRMVRRKRWSKQDSNDGTTRVAVPGQFFRAKRTKLNAPGQLVVEKSQNVPGLSPGVNSENSPIISALSEHIVTLRQQLALAQMAAAEVPVLAERVGRAEADAAALREALIRETGQLEQAEAARKAAEAQRDAAQVARDATAAAFVSWTAGGPLIRAWRAFLNK
ncbi:MAG: hypothetical protein EOP02_05250 [Proteobacteria bacterium]|nr:MAG: hypothetical protein EOP02_05250 [Pseudomonadota bacterium]